MAATSFPQLSYILISYAAFWHTHTHTLGQLALAYCNHMPRPLRPITVATIAVAATAAAKTTNSACRRRLLLLLFLLLYQINAQPAYILLSPLVLLLLLSCFSSRLFDLHIDKATQLVKPQNEPKSDKGLWRQ